MKTLAELMGGSTVRPIPPRDASIPRGKPCCGGCGEAASNDALLAPIFAGWAGSLKAPPHSYRITAAIPHLDTIEPLKVCIEVLRSQSERPYIMVIDTGSPRKIRTEL